MRADAAGQRQRATSRARSRSTRSTRSWSTCSSFAFKCDITRVASFQYTGSVGYTVFHMLGQAMGHHDMTHDTAQNDLVDAATDPHHRRVRGYLLKRLKETTEDGTATSSTSRA
jgi:hypothetical protein